MPLLTPSRWICLIGISLAIALAPFAVAAQPPDSPPAAPTRFEFQGERIRTWTDQTGVFKTDATLLSMGEKEVRLRKPDGEVVEVGIERFSDQDQAYLESKLLGSQQFQRIVNSMFFGHGKNAPKTKVGRVIHARLGDTERERFIADHLHFCAFDNGENDFLYVGTTYGMFSKGELELSVDRKVVAKLGVPHLVYGGVMLPLGDVFNGDPEPDPGMYGGDGIAITKISGVFK